MRTRVIRVLISLSILLTATPWFVSGSDSVVGLTEGAGRLAAFAAAVGLLLHFFKRRSAWIGLGFAAAVTWREVVRLVGDDAIDIGVGLAAATFCATAAAVLMLAELFADIRASSADPESS